MKSLLKRKDVAAFYMLPNDVQEHLSPDLAQYFSTDGISQI